MLFRAIKSIKPFFNRILGSEIQPPLRKVKMDLPNTKPIVWIDCEMTGLDEKKDRIIEIACIVTDSNLQPMCEGINLVVHQPDSLLSSMNEWCTKTHTATGLYKAVQESTITETEAEERVLELLKKHVKPKESPLAGNTIYMDRIFLMQCMPRVHDYLHYRLIDVSTIKELCHRWNLDIYKGQKSKKLVHRALDDIHESINELKYYREAWFKS